MNSTSVLGFGLAVLALAVAGETTAEIFKCTNATGRVSYQDEPCPRGVKQGTVEAPPPPPPAQPPLRTPRPPTPPPAQPAPRATSSLAHGPSTTERKSIVARAAPVTRDRTRRRSGT
jgi:hypothetical protein